MTAPMAPEGPGMATAVPKLPPKTDANVHDQIFGLGTSTGFGKYDIYSGKIPGYFFTGPGGNEKRIFDAAIAAGVVPDSPAGLETLMAWLGGGYDALLKGIGDDNGKAFFRWYGDQINKNNALNGAPLITVTLPGDVAPVTQRVGSRIGIQFLTAFGHPSDVSADSVDILALSSDANPSAVLGIQGMRTVTPMSNGTNRYSAWQRFALRGVRFLDIGASDSSQLPTGWWSPVSPSQVGEKDLLYPTRAERVKFGSKAVIQQYEQQTLAEVFALTGKVSGDTVSGGVTDPPAAWTKPFATIAGPPPPIILQPSKSPYSSATNPTIDAPIRPDSSLPTGGQNDKTTIPVVSIQRAPVAVATNTADAPAATPTPAPPNPADAAKWMKYVLIAVVALTIVALAARRAR
jgi:hypothetical protein